jgi:hypothetical protein
LPGPSWPEASHTLQLPSKTKPRRKSTGFVSGPERPFGRPAVAYVRTGYSAPTSLPPPVPQT